MNPDSKHCKSKSNSGMSISEGSTAPKYNKEVTNSTPAISNKEEGPSSPKKAPGSVLEDASSKESSSTTNSQPQERSALHNTKTQTTTQRNEKQQKASKTEKKKLRKGKWMVEEEQYTAHIIKCFNDGLLTLPEGSTLRGYLADRLNCNPMRITKKFTGACGLTRRVYHLHDRRNASPAEVERTKAELNHLEQRFRIRVEQEHSGLPLSHRDGIFHSQVQNGIGPSLPLQHPSPAAYLHPWAQSFPDVASSQIFLGVPGCRQLHAGPSSQYPFSSPLGQWMLPNHAETIPTSASAALHNDTSAHFLTSLMTSYMAQVAAASIASPATVFPQKQQINKGVEKVLQRQAVSEESKVETKFENIPKSYEENSRRKNIARLPSSNQPSSDKNSAASMYTNLSPVQQLQRGYEAHLESLRKSSSTDPSFANSKKRKIESQIEKERSLDTNKSDKEAEKSKESGGEDDEGTILLLDFMKSAQRAYGDPPSTKADKTEGRLSALNADKRRRNAILQTPSPSSANEITIQSSRNCAQDRKYRLQSATVTDTSTLSRSETSSRTWSQPTESSGSIEDSDSKSEKTDAWSGEESEKEVTGDIRYRGPLRKRLKSTSSVKEFTAQNVAEHSRILDKRNGVEDKKVGA